MTKIEILRIESLSREPLVVEGFLFKGKNKKAPKVAIVGAMEGEGIMPLYCASTLVDFLKNKIDTKKIKGDILVIPSVNHYAFNTGKRFWPLDNTDINMMFPGYHLGETTQRIAQKLFDVVSKYDHAILLEKRPDPVNCIPYVKLYNTGFEDLNGARKFGLKFIDHRRLKSIDTASFQYNLQVWETNVYSIMCPNRTYIDKKVSSEINQGILRFLNKSKVIDFSIFNGYESTIVKKENIEVIKSPLSGIFISKELAGNYVSKGQVLGEIVDSLEGNIITEFISPCNGMITCFYSNSLIYEHAVAFRLAKIG